MSRTDHRGLKVNPTGARSTESDIDQDSLHGILSNSRRRHVIQSLATNDQLALSNTAERLASIEQGKPIAELDDQDRKRIYISLYQTHLPKLDSVGIIDFDSSEGRITRGPIYRVASDAMSAGTEAIHGPDSFVERVKNFFEGATA